MLFSDKIKQLRIESGKRQKDLAKAIGVDVPAYSRYEHGERRPKREQVLRLARIFKTDADELVAMWLPPFSEQKNKTLWSFVNETQPLRAVLPVFGFLSAASPKRSRARRPRMRSC